jgi:2-oxoglutarate dehydrogenase E1 component
LQRYDMAPRFQTLFKQENIARPLDALHYAGRAPAASTATGYGQVHAEEQVGLIKEALMDEYDNESLCQYGRV